MHRIEGKNFIRDATTGKFLFQNGPPGTTVPAEWLNAVQEEISGVIEGLGVNLYTQGTERYGQLYEAISRFANAGYDIIVQSQEQFNSIIERTGANTYQFRSEYKSIYFKSIVGGYQMSGPSSPLSGGDAYGNLQTNNVSMIFCESAAFIDFADNPGYIEFNTTGGLYFNIDIQGTGFAAAAVTRSFYLNADYISLFRCKTSLRITNVGMAAFYGEVATTKTCCLYGCSAFSLRQDAAQTLQGYYFLTSLSNCQFTNNSTTTALANIIGFNSCNNISNPFVNTISTTTGFLKAFLQCYNITGGSVNTLTSTTGAITAADGCSNISSLYINGLTSTTGTLEGFDTCYQISSCIVLSLSSGAEVRGFTTCSNISSSKVSTIAYTGGGSPAGVAAVGFASCNQISSCRVNTIDSNSALAGTPTAVGFRSCKVLSACYAEDIDTSAASWTVGFYLCDCLTGCYAYDIATSSTSNVYGFANCNQLSGCLAEKIDANAGASVGFGTCSRMSACYATDVDGAGTVNGYNGCTYGAALSTDEVANAGNDYIDTVDATITNKNSCHASAWT